MKPCPECGKTMRLGMGQWIHLKAEACRIVSLRATSEEVAAQAPPTRPTRARASRPENPRRFGFQNPDGTSNAPGR